MQTHNLVLVPAVVVCIPLVFAVGVDADEQQDAARMKQLFADIQKVLPPAWIIEIKLADPRIPSRPGPHPALVIKSAEPLPVKCFYPGMPERSVEEREPPPKTAKKIVAVQFIAFPFLSLESYKTARKRNDTLRQTRLQFEREHLKGIRSTYKGSEPIPPYAYEPRTEDEAQLVRQYAFLWVSTQPDLLPTHHTDHLAFEMHDAGSIKIHDAKKSKEYHQILDAVQKTIVPYENEH